MDALAQDRGVLPGLPVTADIETGYADANGAFDDRELQATVRGVLAAGAVGVNFEDSGDEPLTGVEEQAAPDRRRPPDSRGSRR